jgi:hypothetical protein
MGRRGKEKNTVLYGSQYFVQYCKSWMGSCAIAQHSHGGCCWLALAQADSTRSASPARRQHLPGRLAAPACFPPLPDTGKYCWYEHPGASWSILEHQGPSLSACCQPERQPICPHRCRASVLPSQHKSAPSRWPPVHLCGGSSLEAFSQSGFYSWILWTSLLILKRQRLIDALASIARAP